MPQICVEKDACLEARCHHHCLNVENERARFTCTCRAGYILAEDFSSCIKTGVPDPTITIDEALKSAHVMVQFPENQANSTQFIKNVRIEVHTSDNEEKIFNYKFWTDSNQPFEILDLMPNQNFNATLKFQDQNGFNLLNPVTFNGKTRDPNLVLEATEITHDSIELKWKSNFEDLSRNTQKNIQWSLYENGQHQGETTISPGTIVRNQKTIADLRPATPYIFRLSENIEGEEISQTITVTTLKPQLSIHLVGSPTQTSVKIGWNRVDYESQGRIVSKSYFRVK